MKKRKIILWSSLTLLTGIVLLHVVLLLLVHAGVFGRLPDKTELKQVKNPVATEVYSADGVLMGTYHFQNRQFLHPEEIPESVRSALVATEDVRFYRHRGIDSRSLFRVFFKTLLLQRKESGGGSTLTQQLAKNLYPRGNHGIFSMPTNKMREMVIARRIEKVYTKDEILESYLSTVPFGENTFGIKSASRRYFNRDPQELGMEEVGVLVGMLKATQSYNPVRNPEQARNRRNVVLGQMGKYGYLEQTTVDSLKELPLEVDYHPLPHNAGIAPYFREFLRLELEEWCRVQSDNSTESFNLYTDGLKVHTTIDSRLQQYGEDAVKGHMARLQKIFDDEWRGMDLWEGIPKQQLMINYEGDYQPEMESEEPRRMEVFTWNGPEEREFNTLDSIKHYLGLLQAGFLAMEVGTAEIKAWVGGIEHEYFKYDHVRAKRQVGSTFKPLVYLEALEQGYSPCDYFANDSIVYEQYDDWTPRNADREYGGYYSLKGGLVHSVNTVSANLLMQVGIDSVIELAQLAGIQSELPAVPSLSLGTGDISLYEMLRVFQTIANRGKAREPVYLSRIEDRDGRILFEKSPYGEDSTICRPENAEIMIEMLRGVVNEGTASGLRSGYGFTADMAGKTGTTQNYTDGWFIGFTPGIVAGAWVGGDLQNVRFQSMQTGQGAVTAMPIWAEFMNGTFNDPYWSYLEKEVFDISAFTSSQLLCEDYRETRPRRFRPFEELRERRFLRELFKRRRRR